MILIWLIATMGLHGLQFAMSWWRTGDLSAAYVGWVAHDLPNVPIDLVAVTLTITWAFVVLRKREARWEERPDGYQPDRP